MFFWGLQCEAEREADVLHLSTSPWLEKTTAFQQHSSSGTAHTSSTAAITAIWISHPDLHRTPDRSQLCFVLLPSQFHPQSSLCTWFNSAVRKGHLPTSSPLESLQSHVTSSPPGSRDSRSEGRRVPRTP